MENITQPQIKKLHVLLSNLGLIDQKADIVYNLTDGRTSSSRELTIEEASRLISSLAQYDPTERLKSVIFSLAYKAGIIYGTTADDKLMNAAKLNSFLKERGAVKLELNQMSYTDLVKVHKQFEAIVSNNQKAIDKKEAAVLVQNLLNEVNIRVYESKANRH